MVNDAVDSHPLRLDAETVVLLLHLRIVRVLHLALVTLPIILTRAIVQRRGLVHVIFPLIVSVHYQVEDFQLLGHRGREQEDAETVLAKQEAEHEIKELLVLLKV